MHFFTLHRINQLVCDKMLPRSEFTFPSWLPGFLSYREFMEHALNYRDPITDQDLFVSPRTKVSLLVINAMLPLIAIITLDNVTTGL